TSSPIALVIRSIAQAVERRPLLSLRPCLVTAGEAARRRRHLVPRHAPLFYSAAAALR
ncbi:hypothetical protein Dimus_005595, partial [Dionaea muscipula]